MLVKQGLPQNKILCFQCVTLLFITASFRLATQLCTKLQPSLMRKPVVTIKTWQSILSHAVTKAFYWARYEIRLKIHEMQLGD